MKLAPGTTDEGSLFFGDHSVPFLATPFYSDCVSSALSHSVSLLCLALISNPIPFLTQSMQTQPLVDQCQRSCCFGDSWEEELARELRFCCEVIPKRYLTVHAGQITAVHCIQPCHIRPWCAPQCAAMTSVPDVPKALRLAVIGDVHYDWDPVKDYMALKVLKPDLVLFTGDFGEEAVELVRSVSDLNFPKCVILGNHDCWWSAGSFKRQKKYRQDPYQDPDNITAQLLALGPEHVGYGRLDYPQYQISVVGGRPFSTGGSNFNPAELLAERYGVRSMEDSEVRITEMALGAPVDHSLVFLAHNGPYGLGSKKHDTCGLGPNRYDICGKDWVKKAGDHGDADLTRAIRNVQSTGRRKIPLVVFGHMHKKLKVVGERTMIVPSPDGTVYLNAAVVPRFREMIVADRNSTEPAPQVKPNVSSDNVLFRVSDRQFTVVDFEKGVLHRIAQVWVREGDPAWIVECIQIYPREQQLGEASVAQCSMV